MVIYHGYLRISSCLNATDIIFVPNNTDICVVSCGIYHGYLPPVDIRGICHRIQRRYPCYRHKYCIVSYEALVSLGGILKSAAKCGRRCRRMQLTTDKRWNQWRQLNLMLPSRPRNSPCKHKLTCCQLCGRSTHTFNGDVKLLVEVCHIPALCARSKGTLLLASPPKHFVSGAIVIAA